MNPSVDCAGLTRNWSVRWPELRPIGHELRGGDRWVRFHNLPESKRYAESESDRAEILRRHNIVIAEMTAASTGPVDALAVVTCSWSASSKPTSRDDKLESTSPNATFWHSVLREVDEHDEFWTHLFVDVVPWKLGALDDLLLLVADSGAGDVILAPTDFEWLDHPYDGGADVIAPTTERRDEIKDHHRDWLCDHPEGL